MQKKEKTRSWGKKQQDKKEEEEETFGKKGRRE